MENTPITTDTGERQLVSGSSDQILEDIQALQEEGVTDLVLNFQRGALEPSLDAMQAFVDEVRCRL